MAYLGELFRLGLENIDLVAHGIDLGHHLCPQVVAEALDGGDDVDVQPAQDQSSASA